MNTLSKKTIKGPGSIETNYKWLKRKDWKIVVDKSCKNLIKELRKHKNKVSASGVVLPQPEDKDNHFIDALRYAFNDEIMQTKTQTKFRRGI